MKATDEAMAVTGAATVLRSARGSRFARFAMVGASGVVVNLSALWLLAGVLGIREEVASAIAVEVSIVSNFLLNNTFTYRDRNARAQAGLAERLVRYNLVSLVGLAIQLGTFVLARTLVVHGLHRESLGALRYAAQCAGIVMATAWSFAGNFHFTWRQTPAGEGAA
jgi:putative flippase GtrA